MKRIITVLIALILFINPVIGQAGVVSANDTPRGVDVKTLGTKAQLDAFLAADGEVISFEAGQESQVIRLSVPNKGLLKFATANIAGGGSGYLTQELYIDEACTTQVGSKNSLFASDNQVSIKDIYISAQGIYYLKMTKSKPEAPSQHSFRATFISSADRTITSKKASLAYYNGVKVPVYHKLTVAKDGVIRVDARFARNIDGIYVTLCNSKKSQISDEFYLSSSGNQKPAYFAVKKGTYYVKAHNTVVAESREITATFTAVTDQSSATKAKAVTLKKGGAAKKGFIGLTEKTGAADWYKVTLTKKQKLSVTISGKFNGNIKAEIIGAPKYSSSAINFTRFSDKNTINTYSTLNKGTYYIKVSKTKGASSAYYSIKAN